MDDQNNNPGGTAPSEPAAQPVTEQPASDMPTAMPSEQAPAPAEQKCMTCGNAASAGNCSTCGMGEVNCTCTPSSGQGGPTPGEPTPPVGEQSGGIPAV